MNLFECKSQCCGCEACINVCPKDAISMETDEYGFEYPKINNEKCVSCGRCLQVCQYKSENKFKTETKAVYAAASKDKDILMTTASGGIFTTLAEKFIENDGVVYGASLYVDGKINPSHIRVDNHKDLELLKGSKYVQCSVGNIYTKIKKDLLDEKKVLFCGTPCQIAGLKNYLGKEYDRLFTIDIICHGVPSKKFFMDSLKVLGGRGEVKEFNFRDKTKGQGCNAKYVIEENGRKKEIVQNGRLISYFGLFLRQETYRESCYSCLHTSKMRCGDLTIGDYWDIYIEHGNDVDKANLTNKKGISCVLVNTEKGSKLLDKNISEFNLLKSEFEKVSRHNQQLHEPSKYTGYRDMILDMYGKYGFKAVDDMYQNSIKWKRLIYKLEFIMPKDIKTKIKKMMFQIKR